MERIKIRIESLEWVLKNAKIFHVESLSIINTEIKVVKRAAIPTSPKFCIASSLSSVVNTQTSLRQTLVLSESSTTEPPGASGLRRIKSHIFVSMKNCKIVGQTKAC